MYDITDVQIERKSLKDYFLIPVFVDTVVVVDVIDRL